MDWPAAFAGALKDTSMTFCSYVPDNRLMPILEQIEREPCRSPITRSATVSERRIWPPCPVVQMRAADGAASALCRFRPLAQGPFGGVQASWGEADHVGRCL